MRLYKLTLSYGLKTYMTSRRPIGEREAIRHAAAVVGKLQCPAWGWWWSDSLKSYKPSQAYKIAKKGEKTGGFAHVFAYKSPKTPFFALKYLTRYTHETFFEEYIYFKIFRNLSHCGVIPVRSFGSHIRPQPHGLGLIGEFYNNRRSMANSCLSFAYSFVSLLLRQYYWCCVSYSANR
jgi:hypothetical protein